LKKNGRPVSINGIDVTITAMDYDYPSNMHNVRQQKFDITFDVNVNNLAFAINFSNERLSNQNQYLVDTFIGIGEAYNEFLKQVESNPELRNKSQYSDDTINAANTEIGAIAQSVYMHVVSHSPDQDEE
jgi:hypothetical protein